MSAWQERPVTFGCNGDRLVAILHEASSRDVGVLFIVGGPQYRAGSHRQFVLMARDFAFAGFPVFRFDYRGMGDSEGSPRTFEDVNDDIKAAVDSFIANVPRLRSVVLWGLCDAAAASLMYAHSDPRVRGVILANPWVHTEAGAANAYIKHYYGQRLLQRSFWAKVFRGEFNLVASVIDFGRKLVRSLTMRSAADSDSQLMFIERMKRGFERFDGRVLLLMSEHDLTAQEFRGLCAQERDWASLLCRSTHRTVELHGADHTFSSRVSLRSATHHCVEWLLEQAAVEMQSHERRA